MRAILNYCILFFRKIPIIMPDSNFKLIWDIIMMFTVLLNLLYIPLNLSFEFSDSNDVLRYFFDEFLFMMFLTEVILSLFTAYYSKGILIKAKKKIIKNYFAYEYYIDFLTIFPYLVRKVYDFDSLNIFLLFRIFKMKKIFRKLEDHLHLSDQVKGLYELSKLILIIVYVGHFFACAWIYMANMQIKAGEPITWLHGQNIIDKPWLEKYIFSLYFSVYTMVTVGYGDISSNIAEKLFCIIMMIMSCGVFAYSINRLGSILEEMYQKETEFKKIIFDITHYMRMRKVDSELQMRIKRYLEYMNEEKISGFHRGEYILDYLSPRLKNELNENIYEKWINNIPILKNNFSSDFLKKLPFLLEEKTYSPDDIIYEKGERDNLGLFYIIKGQIGIYLENKEKKIEILNKDRSFGEFSFFTNNPREESIRSSQVTHAIFINRIAFINLLKESEDDYEKFNSIKDILGLYENKSILSRSCPSCSKKDHFIGKCPLINLQENKHKIIQNHLFNTLNQRSEYKKRCINKRMNVLKNLKIIVNKTRSFEGIQIYNKNNKNELFIDYMRMMKTEFEDDNELNEILSECNDIENSDSMEDIQTDSIKKNEKSSCSSPKSPKMKNHFNFDENDKILLLDSEQILEKLKNQKNNIDCHKIEEKNIKMNLEGEKDFTNLIQFDTQTKILKKEKEKDKRYAHNEDLNDFDIRLHFDKMKNYKFYFVHNNIEAIIKKENLFNFKNNLKNILRDRKSSKILKKALLRNSFRIVPLHKNKILKLKKK